ncbi:MAG: hypothetical protein ACTSVY_08385, partial [Candidatus Helarchaeota archaeon]
MAFREIDRYQSGYGHHFESGQYQKFADYEIELMIQQEYIKNFLKVLVKLQSRDTFSFYPQTENRIQSYFERVAGNFNINDLKYQKENDFNIIAKTISSIGNSGYNFIINVKHLIPLNQPLFLFYGIEQLATFYSYMFFNYTQENLNYNEIRARFLMHGLDSRDFRNISNNMNIEDILNCKIKLKKKGAASRFFLLMDIPIEFFLEERTFSMWELMHVFFRKLRIGMPNEFIRNFSRDFHDFTSIDIDYHQDLDLLIYYCLSFLFSHLSRYKMYIWQDLIDCVNYNLGFYLKFLMKKISELFLRKIFS